MVFFDAARLATIGIVVGLIPGCLLTYALSTLIFGVEPVDLVVIVTADGNPHRRIGTGVIPAREKCAKSGSGGCAQD